MDNELFPMSPELIAKDQKGDQHIQKIIKTSSRPLKEQTIEGVLLLTLENQIIIPEVLQQHIVAWYHLYLKHPGQTWMENTLKSVYWWKNMREDITTYVKTCCTCQLCKKTRKKYGHFPRKDVEATVLWNRDKVDLIGPLSVKTKCKMLYVLIALTKLIQPLDGSKLQKSRKELQNMLQRHLTTYG
jgi:Integrase zinc binding domain